MPVSLKFLVNTVTGSVTTLNACKDPAEEDPTKEEEEEKEVYVPTRFKKEDLPSMVDMREFMTDIEDQAGAGSCTANAVVGAFEYVMGRAGKKVDFSRLFVYYNARVLDNQVTAEWAKKQAADKGEEFDEKDESLHTISDDGSSIHHALQSLWTFGVYHEETWDYVVKSGSNVPNVNKRPSEQAYDEARQLKESPRFQWEMPEPLPTDLFAMKHCLLAEGYPFVFSLVLFKGFDVAKKHGYVPIPDFKIEDIRETHGSHAMLCVGYKESAKVFIVRNSWGPTWGDKGYCYIPYDYMTNPEICRRQYKVKGHLFRTDLSKGVWKEDDGDFDKSFYEIPSEEDDEMLIFGLEESIAVISYIGIGVDGISVEEQGKLFDLFEEYKIDPTELRAKIDIITHLGEGLKTWYEAAVQIILSYNEAMLAFRVSAEFAFADGKLTCEEQEYWDKLAIDLGINEKTAALVFSNLFEANPESEMLV